MNINLKVKALTRLTQSNSQGAIKALSEELDKAEALLSNSTVYEVVDRELQIIDVLKETWPDRVLQILIKFVGSIDQITYTYEEVDSEAISLYLHRPNNQERLLIKALEGIRFFCDYKPKIVFELFLDKTLSPSEKVRKFANEALNRIASFRPINLNSESEFQTQRIILDELKRLTPDLPSKYLGPTLIILSAFLENEVKFAHWQNYNTLTLSRGNVPASPMLSSIRTETVDLLKSLYSMADNLRDKIKILDTLNGAARSDTALKDIVVNNSISVIKFYRELLKTEVYPIIQKIEHYGFWIFFHTQTPDVCDEALSLERDISANKEYEIYKTLIGFEGVFGGWENLKADSIKSEKTNEVRSSKIIEYVNSITIDNFKVWKQRILNFSLVKSDDMATFPKFHEFLELFSKTYPNLALQLVTDSTERISPFLIPILKSLWMGAERNKVRICIQAWVNEGLYLYQCAKIFLENSEVDFELVDSILEKSKELKTLDTIAIFPAIAISNIELRDQDSEKYIQLFMKAIEISNELHSSSWIFDVWFRNQTASLIARLNREQIDLVLTNMLDLAELDYQAEEILFLISKFDASRVIDYLCNRIKYEDKNQNYDSIPFEFYKLNESLSKAPSYLLEALYKLYIEDSYLFQYKGARLARVILKDIDQASEDAIINFINLSPEHTLFVISILRNYEGQSFIYPIVKKIVKLIPLESEYWSELEIILNSTGVVSGEFGFVNAYKNKKELVTPWLQDENPKVVSFSQRYISNIDISINAEQQRAEEQVILRKQRFE